ncbi:hypothetical protein OGV58_10510, partial [Citrobacter sp. Cf097]
EWVHVQLHQQKGMISLSPPTICNSAKKSAQKILEKKSVSADTASAGCAYFRTMDSHPLRDGENELAALQQSK